MVKYFNPNRQAVAPQYEYTDFHILCGHVMTKSTRQLGSQCKVFRTLKSTTSPDTELTNDQEGMLRRKARDAADNLELGNPINFVPVMQVKKFACKRVMTYLVLIGLGIVAHSMYRIFFTVRTTSE